MAQFFSVILRLPVRVHALHTHAMDLPATLDVVDGPLSGEDESQEESVTWGRLFSVGKGFTGIGW